MVYNPNANWTAKTNLAAKQPTYYIAIDGLTTKHYSTSKVRAAGTTKLALMKVPDQIGQKVSQLQGRQSITVFSFDLVDNAGEITDLISTEKESPVFSTLVNRKVTLFSGYLDLDEADFAPIGLAEISDVKLNKDGTTYRFTLRDLKRAQLDDIFTNAEATGTVPVNTKLAADANAGTRTLQLLDVSNISAGGAGQGSGTGDKLYIGPSSDVGDSGDEEKVQVAAIEGLIVTTVKDLVSSYKAGDEVRWATTVIRGNPINLIYAVQTGDFANGTFPLTKLRGEPTGLGIAAADIDSAGMQKERDRMIPAHEMEFELKDSVAGFRFLEQKIFRLFGYPIVKGDGKIGFRLYRPAWPDDAGAGLPKIEEKDVRSFEWLRPQDLHVNRVRLGIDIDAETGKPATIVLEEDTADQTATGETAEIDEEDTGFRASLRGVRLAEERAAIWFRRFLKEPSQIKSKTGLLKRAIEAGDVVEFTHSHVPDIKTGTRGLTNKRLEVVEVKHGLKGEEMDFLLQDAGFVRPAFVGPAGAIPGYDSATAAERESAYVGKPGFPVPDFDDGTRPYEVI